MEDDDCDDKTILQHIKASVGRESRAKKGPGIQEVLISPTEMDKNVFFPSFEHWIQECRKKIVDGYGEAIIDKIT